MVHLYTRESNWTLGSIVEEGLTQCHKWEYRGTSPVLWQLVTFRDIACLPSSTFWCAISTKIRADDRARLWPWRLGIHKGPGVVNSTVIESVIYAWLDTVGEEGVHCLMWNYQTSQITGQGHLVWGRSLLRDVGLIMSKNGQHRPYALSHRSVDCVTTFW